MINWSAVSWANVVWSVAYPVILVAAGYSYGVKVEANKCLKSDLSDATSVVQGAEHAKDITTQRLDAQKEAQDEQVKQRTDDGHKLDDAGDSVDRLQQRIKALQDQLSDRSCDAALARCRTTTAALGRTLSACAQEYKSLGADYAEDRAAGTLAERSYDALTTAR